MSFARSVASFATALTALALLRCGGSETPPNPDNGAAARGGAAGSAGSARGGAAGAVAGRAGAGGAGGGSSGSAGTGVTAGSAGFVSNGGTAGSVGGSPAGGAGANAGTAGAFGGAGLGGGGAGQGGTAGSTAGGGLGGQTATGGAGAANQGGAGASGAGGAGGVSAGAGGKAGNAGAGGKAGAGGSAGTSSDLTDFMIGADISQVQQQEAGGTRFVDGSQKDIFQLLKDRGFNWIRLRVFVDPTAQGGYSTQGYCDLAHTVTMGRRIKEAGLGFLLDFHYSDYWADPGKQIKPLAWRNIGTIGELATTLQNYTEDAVQALVDGGARPDMVQIGNEITPGMVLHVPNNPSQPDGALTVTTPNGSINNWTNLGSLLKAGVNGVHAVDPSIKIMLHTDRGGSSSASVSFVQNAINQNVPFDVYAVSCYVEYQGGPSTCSTTLTAVLNANPNATFKVAIAEYAVDSTSQSTITTTVRGTNDAVFNLPNQRGAGTFFWEPTRSGAWGDGLFTFSGQNANAVTAYMNLYDQMKVDFAR